MSSFRISSLSIVLVLVIYLVPHCSSKAVEGEEQKASANKRIADDDVANIVEELTSIIQGLKLDQFVGETVLKQYVDKHNEVSVYRLPEIGKTKGPVVYERKSNDTDKEAIVLLPSQDKISSRKKKKTFVGLKSTGAAGADEYFVFYIYLR